MLFGTFMAITAAAVLLYSAEWFAGLVVILALFAAREWHRLVRSPVMRELAEQRPIHVQTVITAIAVALSVFMLLEDFLLPALGVVAARRAGVLLFRQGA